MTFHPRRVALETGLHHAGRSLPVMAGGVLVFVGGLLTVIALLGWWSERRYRLHGASAQATVIRSRPTGEKGASLATIRYRDPSTGLEVDRDLAYTPEGGEGVPGTLRIEYVPGDVASARLPNPYALVGLAIALGLSVPLGAAGVYVMARGLQQVGTARRLARGGARAEGTVIEVRASNMTVDGRPQVIVRFRYRAADGGVHEGLSWPLDPAEGWSAGDTGIVRYDPADPATALWVGREH